LANGQSRQAKTRKTKEEMDRHYLSRLAKNLSIILRQNRRQTWDHKIALLRSIIDLSKAILWSQNFLKSLYIPVIITGM